MVRSNEGYAVREGKLCREPAATSACQCLPCRHDTGQTSDVSLRCDLRCVGLCLVMHMQLIGLLPCQVHASLRKGGMDKKTLRYFDVDDADMLLYELRFLDLSARPAAAAFIAEKELSTPVRLFPTRCAAAQQFM